MAPDLDQSASLEIAVRDAVRSAPWISAADVAAVRLAVLLARDVDSADDAKDRANTARVLAVILRDLGLSLAGRSDSASAPREVTTLDTLRAASSARLLKAATHNPTPKTQK